jgi:hypothetical protein
MLGLSKEFLLTEKIRTRGLGSLWSRRSLFFGLMVERKGIYGGKRSCIYRQILEFTWEFIRQIEFIMFA